MLGPDLQLAGLSRQINDIAKKAGEFIRQESRLFSREKIEYKDFNNLVSYVDKEAEKMIVEALQKLLPEAGFITEEGTTGQNADRTGLTWIIDPLDGTANFIHGLPVFSVSIGLADGKNPLAGTVYDINRDECYHARLGGGAWCSRNGGVDERIRVSPATRLHESMVATGFPYASMDRIERYLAILASLMLRTHGLRRMGSAAIDLAYVACGRFEAFYEFNLNSWDMAAGVLLVREAGGIVTDFRGGDEFLFRGDVLAGCAMQPELLAVIEEYWNNEGTLPIPPPVK
ncbi:inositol monophosphatase family protein [Larkinella rosea]|uniref:Inositol-1-monophosphatase n=1 Tax=Larkinella rosea TaxID=2025312 RepID=A0A3P1BPA1_9BACT|nr:inositol monophosphatase family protein [Larkinella rosea]RRB02891.1 inositol monophosphatase [Larkinella rosea]